jgi:hypothetical protein
MVTALQSLRLFVVNALALSLTVGPFCAMSVGAACPLAQADHAGHLAPGKCCCGENCHCTNCPSAHPEQQQKKKETPVNQTDSHDLAKIKIVAVYSLFWNVGNDATLTSFPPRFSEGEHRQTLISQHTCLRV